MNKKHGLSHTREYKLCTEAKKRCTNINVKCYKNYGGRGITIYNEWKNNIGLFVKYMLDNFGKCPTNYTIDRIDVNKGYEPNNVRWADKSTQCANKRKIDNKSGYTGVYIRKNGTFCSRICCNYKIIDLGYFKTLKEAILARNMYITKNNLPHPLQKIGSIL